MVSTWWGHYRTWGDHTGSLMMNTRAVTLLMLLCLWASGEPASLCPGSTNEAYQILLDVLQDLQIDESDIKGSCVPVYRLDLPKTYVAYHVVSTKKEFLVISAGKKTCDSDLIAQSENTSPIKILDKAAGKNKDKCHRYYLLNGVADMVCKDTKGKTVASTFDKDTLNHILENVTSLDAYLEDQSKALKNYFKERCKSLQEANKGHEPPEGRNGFIGFTQVALAPGATKVIVLKSAPKEVKIHYIHEKQSTTGQEKTAGLKQVCGDIEGCSVKGSFGVMASSTIKTDPDRLKLELSVDAEENGFEVEIKYKVDKTDKYYFAIVRPQPRKRGWFEYDYSPYSTLCYIRAYNSNVYPKYTRFRWGGCPIGNGAMALAHVFAYYDRLGRCRCLYGDRYNGLSGNCYLEAPTYRDTRLTRYAVSLKNIIRGQCSGKVYVYDMLRVRSYFAKQCYDREIPYKIKNKDSDLDIYKWVLHSVCLGRPVIVMHRDVFGYPYFTAVGAREKPYVYRYCYSYTNCTRWTQDYRHTYELDWNDGRHRGWYSMYAVCYFAMVPQL